MNTITDRKMKTSQQILDTLGDEGDNLMQRRLPRVGNDDHYVPIEAGTNHPVLLTSLLFEYTNRLGNGGAALAVPALPFLAPIDLILVLLRFSIYPFALLAYFAERRLARLLGRSFFCPLCSNPMREPLVYCPCCRRVQPRLKPHPECLFVRTCSCGRTRWPILGQFFLRRPQPLVCRDTEYVTGCYRPHPLKTLAGASTSRHVAVAGTTVRAKHAVMAHLFAHLAGDDRRVGKHTPAWEISKHELELCEKFLHRSFRVDTSACEQPGERYTLALSFVMRRIGHQGLRVFHNVAQPWMETTAQLARHVLNWKLTHAMVFVIDPELMGRIDDPMVLPQAEAYSRLLRVIEEYCVLPAGSQLPLRIAVVLPLPAAEAAALGVGGLRKGMAGNEVQRVVREKDPALHALLTRSVPGSQLRFFAGPIPDKMDLSETRWLQEVLAWVA